MWTGNFPSSYSLNFHCNYIWLLSEVSASPSDKSEWFCCCCCFLLICYILWDQKDWWHLSYSFESLLVLQYHFHATIIYFCFRISCSHIQKSCFPDMSRVPLSWLSSCVQLLLLCLLQSIYCQHTFWCLFCILFFSFLNLSSRNLLPYYITHFSHGHIIF